MKTQMAVVVLCLGQLLAASTLKPILVYAKPIPDDLIMEEKIAAATSTAGKRSVPPQDNFAFGNNGIGTAGTFGTNLNSLNPLTSQFSFTNPLLSATQSQNWLGSNHWMGQQQFNPLSQQQWNTGSLGSTLTSGLNPLLFNQLSSNNPSNNMLYTRLLQLGGLNNPLNNNLNNPFQNNLNNPFQSVFSRNGLYGVNNDLSLLLQQQQQQNPLMNSNNNLMLNSNPYSMTNSLYNNPLLTSQFLSSGSATGLGLGLQGNYPFSMGTSGLSGVSGLSVKRSAWDPVDPVIMDPKSDYFTLINNSEETNRPKTSYKDS